MSNEKIEVKEGHVYIVVDGEVQTVTPPVSGYGVCQIRWVNGRITESEQASSVKYGLMKDGKFKKG